MGSTRHELISDLFLKACELEPGERKAFLDDACAGDPELRANLESLLVHDKELLLETGDGLARAVSAFLEGAGTADRRGEADDEDLPSTEALARPAGAPRIPGYRIVRLLGKGGMGTVFLAEDTTLGRQVAIKMISEDHAASITGVQRFVREARTMATVEHPNVVRVYAFEEIEGSYHLIMEYVDGESLADRIRRLGKLDVDESLRILRQIVDALAAVWERGIVHRDIKPANVLIDTHDRVRVVDFGLAKKPTAVEGDSSITRDGQVLGTPHYLSPEQARGEGTLDFRSDVYALGIVLFEMLTGETPYQGATPVSIVDKHLHTPLPPMRRHRPDVAGEFEQLCGWMVRKQPADRPASYEELGQIIDALLGKTTAPDLPSPPLPPSLLPDDPRPVFVGRRAELESLQQSLENALGGEGQVVFVSGETGSGKTALINEFARRVQESHEDLIVAVGNCDAHTGAGDPYLPFREVLSLLTADVEFRQASREITREQAWRLWSLLPLAVEALVDGGPDLVGTFVSGEALVSRAVAFTPSPARWRVRLEELVRQRAGTPRDVGLQQSYLFEQYARTLHALAQKHPLLLQLEDLQWADGGSCGLLFHLGRRIAHGRILIVGTYRPAEVELERDGQRHPLRPVLNELQRHFGDLQIRLGENDTPEFVNDLLNADPNDLDAGFREQLFRQTRGHPLFTVELVRSMREQNMLTQDETGRWIEGPAMDWGRLPARVEGAIGERLGRLPEDQLRALTLASVQGEEFAAEVLAEVQGIGTRDMVGMLSRELDKRHRLVAARGSRRINGQRISTYRFRHNLFQVYLYGNLDEQERAYLHEDVGNALETLYGKHVDEVAVQLARHFHEAGITPKTIDYLRRAGDRATQLSANEEAIGHFRRALQELEALTNDRGRARQELELQLSLGAPLLATVGPGSTELSQAYLRARELCDRVGTASQLFQTLFILVHHHANRGPLRTALEVASQLLRVAEDSEEPLPMVMAYWARGFVLHNLGRVTEALEDHERVISVYEPQEHSSLAFIFGMDPAVSSLSFGSVALWILGFADRAMEYSRRAITLARDLDHPSSTAHALVQATFLGMLRRDTESLASQAVELVRLSTEKGVILFRAWGGFVQGWVLAERGSHEEGIVQMHHGLRSLQTAGSQLGRASALGMLAEVHLRAGAVERGLSLVSDAVSVLEESGERVLEAELYRIRGGLLLEQDADSTPEAEASLRRAVELARSQGAKAFELRAAMDLSRLMLSRGEREEARDMLAEIYGRFEEGMDTPDLKKAQARLGELS